MRSRALRTPALSASSRLTEIRPVSSSLNSWGATDTVDASHDDPLTAVRELIGGVDHSIDAIGLKSTTEQASAMLGNGGTATVVGMVQ
jgi:S-(hydroxymethyl)glutathione dehydrogenase/alcohol dehydrogenase